MHKWRSLFGTGCLMAVLALFGSATAFAQPPTTELADGVVVATVPTMGGFNTLSVAWTYTQPTGDTDVKAATFEIGYKQQTGTAFGAGVGLDGMMTVTVSDATTYRVDITGLKAKKAYLVAVRPKSGNASNNAGAWQYQAGTATAGVVVTTADAPKPGVVDHRDVMVTPGDGMLMVEWEDPLPGHDDLMIKEYMVQFSKKEKTGYTDWPHKPTEPMVTITGLANDTMYYVKIKAMNDAGGESAYSKPVMGTPSADAPMPTPALPVFGAFALGAGLLAAGRARLRRREQRQLTR